jgi:phytanoyl-CoA hydroxylase
MVTTENITSQFARDGYACVRKILPEEELHLLRVEMTRMIDEAPLDRESSVDRHGNTVEHAGDFTFSDLDDGRQILARINHQLARSSVMRLAYGNPDVLRLVESVYGREFVPFGESIVIKLPENGSAFPFHQDGNLYDGIQYRGLNLGIYLHASTEANGCLRVIPGSHLQNKVDVHGLRDTHGPILPGSIPLETHPGDICLHDRTLVHGSLPNTSPDLRITVYFGFHKLASVTPLHDAERIKRRAQVVSLCIHERQQSDRYCDETPYDYALSDLAPLPTSPDEVSAVLRETALSL